MIGQCWIAALRPMRGFGLESGPAKCLSLALVYFIEAKFDVILMFERWEARWQLETLVGTLVIFYTYPRNLGKNAAFCHILRFAILCTAFRTSGACCSSL